MSGAPPIDAYFAGLKIASSGDSGVVGIVRDYLADSREFLQELHRSEALGHRVNEAHSNLIDRLVRRLFLSAEEAYFSDRSEQQSVVTLLAVGGYARRELNIHSDVDLLFLYQEPLSDHVKAVVERVQYWLWDAALSVGSATRTATETIALAVDDRTVQTSILAPRYLAGSGVLFHDFVKRVRTELFANPIDFVASQLDSLHDRHRRYGDSLYLLQPNLKEGAGGLRDYHTAYWAVQVTQPGGGRIDDFLHVGLLTENESREYLAALDFLWRVRNEIHLVTRRKIDELSFELQESISGSLGYGGTGDTNAAARVERFMSDYYRHARAVKNYSMLAIEQCHARLLGASSRRKIRKVEEGFRVVNGMLEIPHTRLLSEKPIRLLLAFAVAQDHEVPLTRKALRLVRENLHRIDDAYRHDPEAAAVFLRILDSERWVVRSLIAMNEVGLLGRFLPEWEHIVCRWQHVMYHTYTVDVHTIFLVEELQRLWRGDHERDFPDLTELMRNVDDRPVLFLGCLLHDIGKGLGGDHSKLGAERARECATRLGLAPEKVDRIVFLVEAHLRMAHVAQSRDLSDPKLILEFARVAGDRERLRDLYLLTFADIRASSSQAWTDWKGQLLRELFERTSELIETGSDDPSTAMELIERQVEGRRETACAQLIAQGVAEEGIRAFFDMMPHRYFTAHGPTQISRHAQVVLDYIEGDRVIATAIREIKGDFSEFILCTKDQHGLYANVAGALTAHNINILGAHVYTTRTGELALESYRVGTPGGGREAREAVWTGFESSLEAILNGKVEVRDLLRRRGRPVGIAVAPSQAPARVTIDNEESDFYTIADVTANDRLGLLHDITRVIADFGYEIYISKAATALDQVTDAFYLKNRNRKKIGDPHAVEMLREALLAAAQREVGDGGR